MDPSQLTPFSPLWALLRSGVIGGLVATLLGFFGGLSATADLFSPFRVQLALGLLALLVVFLVGRRWKTSVVLFITLLLNLIPLSPAWIDRSRVALPGDDPACRIVLFNVLTSNSRHEDVLDWIRSQNADVVGLIETDGRWSRSLEQLKDVFPHQVTIPRSDNFGLAMISRSPFTSEVYVMSETSVPTLAGTIEHPLIGPVPFVLTHPIPPMGKERWKDRNDVLRGVAAIHSEEPRRIVMGDLNTPPWSPNFRILTAEAGLHDTRRGFGIQASWPAGNPVLKTPIDHILVGPAVMVRHRAIGPDLGSDHLPVIVDLVFPPPPPGGR